MLSQLTVLLIVAILVEAVIDIVFNIKGLKDFDKKITWFPIQILLSITLGIVICFKVDIDVLKLLFQADSSTFGYIVSGILVSRGSNYIHDLVSKLKLK